MSMKVFLEEIRILTGRLRKADYLPQCWRASSHPLRAKIEQKAENHWVHSLPNCLNWNINLILTWSFWFSSLQARTGICTISSPALRSSNINGFPGSPTCKWQSMRFLSLHNLQGKLYLYITCFHCTLPVLTII